MRSKTQKAIQTVLLALVFIMAQAVVLSVPQGGGPKEKAPEAKKNGKTQSPSQGNTPPCRRGGNPSPTRTCGQPHPEDPADCNCGIGNDGQNPPQPNN